MKAESRRELIEGLLDHLVDYEPSVTSNLDACGGGEGNPPRMPALHWEREVQELYRTLDLLRTEPTLTLRSGKDAEGRTAHAHLIAFYRCEHRIVRPKSTRRVVRGVVHTIESAPSSWKRERVVNPWIIVPLVEAAVDFVESEYRGDPLPFRLIVERLERKDVKRRAAA